jgi:hypothetical protein
LAIVTSLATREPEKSVVELLNTRKSFRVRVISSTDGSEVAIMSNKIVNKFDAAVRASGPLLKKVFVDCGKPLIGLYMEKACRDASMCYNIIRVWFRDGVIDEELWLSIIRDPRPDVCGIPRFAIVCYLAILTHFVLNVTKKDMVIGELSQQACVQGPIPLIQHAQTNLISESSQRQLLHHQNPPLLPPLPSHHQYPFQQQDENSQSSYFSLLPHSDVPNGSINEDATVVVGTEIDSSRHHHQAHHHQPGVPFALPSNDEFDNFGNFGSGHVEHPFYPNSNAVSSYQQPQQQLLTEIANVPLIVQGMHKNAIPDERSSESSRCSSVIQVRTSDELAIDVEDEVTYEHLFCNISKLIAYELDTTISLRITINSSWIYDPPEGEEMNGRIMLRAPQGAVFLPFKLATYTLHTRQRFIAPTSKLSMYMTILDCLPYGFNGHAAECVEIKQELQELMSETPSHKVGLPTEVNSALHNGIDSPESGNNVTKKPRTRITKSKPTEEKGALGGTTEIATPIKRKRKRSTSDTVVEPSDGNLNSKPKRRKHLDAKQPNLPSSTASRTSLGPISPGAFPTTRDSGADLSPTEFYLRSSGIITDDSGGMNALFNEDVPMNEDAVSTTAVATTGNTSPSTFNIPIPRYSPLGIGHGGSDGTTTITTGSAVNGESDLDSILNYAPDNEYKGAGSRRSHRQHHQTRNFRAQRMVKAGEDVADADDSGEEDGDSERKKPGDNSQQQLKKKCIHCTKFYKHAPRHGTCSQCPTNCGSHRANGRFRDRNKKMPLPNVQLNDTEGELFKSFLAHILGVRVNSDEFEEAYNFIHNTGRIKNIAIESCYGCRTDPKFCCRCILEERIDRRHMFIGLMRADNIGTKKVRIAYICSAKCLQSIKAVEKGQQRYYYRDETTRLGNSACSRDVFYLDVQSLPKVLINFNAANEQYLQSIAAPPPPDYTDTNYFQ